MADIKDYAALSDEALLIGIKKIRKNELISATFTGFLIGIMIYGLVMHGFGLLYTLIPIILIAANVRHATKLKEDRREIQAEIDKRAK
jgi:hypothetical protein